MWAGLCHYSRTLSRPQLWGDGQEITVEDARFLGCRSIGRKSAMSQSAQPFKQRASRALVRVFVVLLVLGLMAAVAFLLSQLNARTYSVEQRGDSLVVLKGRNLPFGAAPYIPADPRLAEAYGPLAVEGAPPSTLVGMKFEDRDALDRALFGVLLSRAEARITSEDAREQEQAMRDMRRAEKLSGITAEQQQSLKRLQAEAAFYQARYRLDEARRLTAEALMQLRLASESSTSNARTAHQMLTEVGPAARALEEALRRAVHTLSGPAANRAAQPNEPKQVEGTVVEAPAGPQQPPPPGADATQTPPSAEPPANGASGNEGDVGSLPEEPR